MSRQQDMVDAVLRQDLSSFIAKCFATLEHGGSYRENWHVHHIAYQLTRISKGDVRRLMINIPPRHLKSMCVTVAYTAWAMGHDPSLKVMTVSYGAELAEELAGHFRMIVNTDWYRRLFPAFKVNRSSKGKITTTQNGVRYAFGMGGPIIGRGADLIVIDDPMKAQAAYSEADRIAANAYYDNTLCTRLNDKRQGAIVLVMQRLHQDDLCGHVLEHEPWEQTVIPAIAPENAEYRVGPRPQDVHRRQQGDLIQALREDDDTLDLQRRILGSAGFAAQYQQDPLPSEGNAVRREWLRFYDCSPVFDLTMISWDTASTLGEGSDYSVGTVWGLRGSDIYLVDLLRGRFEVPELRRNIETLHIRHKANATVIEETDIGRALCQEMRRHSVVRPQLWRPRVSKEARILAQAPKFEAGQVLLPREAPWLASYLTELLAFPSSKNDDQVDSTSQALNWLSGRIATGVPRRRPNPVRPKGTEYRAS